jgi:hypothetical protein
MRNDKAAKDDQKNADKAKENARVRDEKIAKAYLETMLKKKAKE